MRADVDRSSRLIKRATHDGMLLNRKEEVQATIDRLAEGPEIAAIRVYDKEGTIMMSAQREEIGHRIGLDSETCLSCHPTGTDERRRGPRAEEPGTRFATTWRFCAICR